LLNIHVNGQLHTTLDVTQQTGLVFHVGEDAQIVEVRAGKTLLATFFLPSFDTLDRSQAFRQELSLEGGQKLSCDVITVTDSDNEITGATLHVQHQETNPFRILVR